MVLEALVGPKSAERHPFEIFFLGILYASVAMFISIQIFDTHAGLIAVFLSVMASMPLVYGAIRYEERKDMETNKGEASLLKEHAKALMFFTTLFLGMVVAFSLWYIFLPAETAQTTFAIQAKTINQINAISGNAIGQSSVFAKIFFNNVKVLAFCILFSFFYGAGAIFILTWNASVIAVAIGNLFRNTIGKYSAAIGLEKVGGYFHIYSISLARYLFHGIPEIVAYFVGGLAGGIISVAIIRHDFRSERFSKILLDVSDLMLVAIAILLFAAFMEVYLTPVFFS